MCKWSISYLDQLVDQVNIYREKMSGFVFQPIRVLVPKNKVHSGWFSHDHNFFFVFCNHRASKIKFFKNQMAYLWNGFVGIVKFSLRV